MNDPKRRYTGSSRSRNADKRRLPVQTAVAILVIAVVYAIGDFISNKTKAFVP
jgi:hypothetical protein